MSINPALLSSTDHTWQTPDSLLELVRQVGPIALDPCTTADNPVDAPSFCVPNGTFLHHITSGLSAGWATLAASHGGLVYVNPPYGREIPKWVAKCVSEAALGAEIVLLVPARPDTAWFQNAANVPNGPTVLFWRGRLKFKGAPSSAPFPSALMYWGIRHNRFMRVFANKGMFT